METKELKENYLELEKMLSKNSVSYKCNIHETVIKNSYIDVKEKINIIKNNLYKIKDDLYDIEKIMINEYIYYYVKDTLNNTIDYTNRYNTPLKELNKIDLYSLATEIVNYNKINNYVYFNLIPTITGINYNNEWNNEVVKNVFETIETKLNFIENNLLQQKKLLYAAGINNISNRILDIEKCFTNFNITGTYFNVNNIEVTIVSNEYTRIYYKENVNNYYFIVCIYPMYKEKINNIPIYIELLNK